VDEKLEIFGFGATYDEGELLEECLMGINREIKLIEEMMKGELVVEGPTTRETIATNDG